VPPGDGLSQGGSAEKTVTATFQTVEDPSISLQGTRRKNTLKAVKCSDNRAKGSAPVPHDVSEEMGQNGAILLLELGQASSLSHPARNQPHAVLACGRVCPCVGSVSGRAGKKCQQCPWMSAPCSKAVLLCACAF